jgi:hypothetical protein
MPKTNSRAISKLLEAQKTLKKLGRTHDTTAGQAFANDLVRMLERGKEGTLSIGNNTMTFKPADVRVSRTRVMIGQMTVCLSALAGGTDGEYSLMDESDSLEVRLAAVERELA